MRAKSSVCVAAAVALVLVGVATTTRAQGTWSTATLSQKRGGLSACASGDQVFFAGGGYYDGSWHKSDVVDTYNASSQAWSTATLSQARNALSAVSAGSQVFFGGGMSSAGVSNVVDLYDTASQVWSTATLSQSRSYVVAAAVGNQVFFGGGMPSAGVSNVVDIYDAASQVWSTATLSQPRSQLSAAAVGDQVFFGGGWTYETPSHYSNVVDIYNTSSQTWSTATLSQARCNLCAVSVGSQIFFAGGYYNPGGGVARGSAVVDIYETSSQTWSTATLSQGRVDLSAASAGAQVLFAGGIYFDSAVGWYESDVVDIYDTASQTWSTATLSQPRSHLSAAAVGDQAFFGGGEGRGFYPPSNIVDIYTIPEPATLSLLAVGLGAIWMKRRRKA